MVLDYLRSLTDGKKSYLIGIAMVLYGTSGYLLETMPREEATRNILEGLAIIFLRQGIAKAER